MRLSIGLAFFISFVRATADANNFKSNSMCSIAEDNLPKAFSVVPGNTDPNESSSTLCSNPVRGQCSFYEDCLETRYHCGPDGYPLGYGKKYCNKFIAAIDKFSPEAQVYMLDVMECLQRALVPETTGPVEPRANGRSPCDDLKRKAYESYAECYVQPSGEPLYTLSVKDWAEVVELIDLKTLYGSREALKEPDKSSWRPERLDVWNYMHFFTQFSLSVILLNSVWWKPECCLFPLIL